VKSEGGKNYIFGTQHGPSICEMMTSYAFGWLKHADIIKERYRKHTQQTQRVSAILEKSGGNGGKVSTETIQGKCQIVANTWSYSRSTQPGLMLGRGGGGGLRAGSDSEVDC
jgi:hypothetical protein